MLIRSFFITAVSLIGHSIQAEPSESLLRNGNFEEIDSQKSAPTHWRGSDWSTKESRGKLLLVSEKENVAEGAAAARIKYQGKGRNLVIFQDVVRGGAANYLLRAKCRPYGDASAYVSLVAFGADQIRRYENSNKVKGEDKWHDLSLTVSADALTDKIRVVLRSNGDAAFDDVSLVLTNLASNLEPSTGAELESKRSELTAEQKADNERKSKMSPEELAWEKVLEQNLGAFYLPRYKTAKLKGRTTAWDYVKDDPALPRVLLIGDSISRGYTVPTRKRLAGKVNLHRAPANCGPTKMGLRKLDTWLGDGKWDLIHFNFGIHDRNTKSEDYAARLEQILDRLKQTDAKIIWATSTPLPKDSKLYKHGECVRLNAVAATVMEKHGIPLNDLYTAILPHLSTYQNPGDCHFSGKGYEFLGDQVADKIMQALAK